MLYHASSLWYNGILPLELSNIISVFCAVAANGRGNRVNGGVCDRAANLGGAFGIPAWL
jgi:hypothetical protein